ncbi:hypothetical protein [Acinetobacter sp. NIPH 2699]|uniref:hypothetical protein n=1 Tax=Acinetobacter sp. NIPH 2699 TaxID=2923433 RepID=UPI001F4A6CF4|nr:hypothetical protein [Acinetobacter sp. NIPH 2699]MCH7337116.1 hypothetical protein [Acinetobacter sp. NIPH 2699]
MRYYLDTNILYNTPAVFNSDKELFISAWVIFEIISGITDDEKFIRRKNILQKLKKSKIKVIEHFHSSLCAEVFSFNYWKIDDVKATMKMYELILECESYKEFINISFLIENNEESYDYQLFRKFDELFTTDHKKLLNDNIDKVKDLDSKQKKYQPLSNLCSCEGFQHRNRDFAKSFAQKYIESAVLDGYYYKELDKKLMKYKPLKNLATSDLEVFSENFKKCKDAPEQIQCLMKFDQVKEIINELIEEELDKSMQSFDNYINNARNFTIPTITNEIALNSILLSQTPGRNDSQDIGHIYFIDYVDFLVSNDGFFQRVNCLKDKVLTVKEFLENHIP